jgi:hypothetical protein
MYDKVLKKQFVEHLTSDGYNISQFTYEVLSTTYVEDITFPTIDEKKMLTLRWIK